VGEVDQIDALPQQGGRQLEMLSEPVPPCSCRNDPGARSQFGDAFLVPDPGDDRELDIGAHVEPAEQGPHIGADAEIGEFAPVDSEAYGHAAIVAAPRDRSIRNLFSPRPGGYTEGCEKPQAIRDRPRGRVRTALVIPSLGGPHLGDCLRSVAALNPPPHEVVLVLSGGGAPPAVGEGCRVERRERRLGYAAAVNLGMDCLSEDTEAVAVLNDDALPAPHWLGALTRALERRPDTAAVQGTVVSADGTRVDGRGITFDRWGLPVQVERGRPLSDDQGEQLLLAVSGTACAFRLQSLRQIALDNGQVFDETFDCYHEDLDVGLRLRRGGWSALWTGGAPVHHLGSASGGRFAWRHPWWLLANRWRALAGNLTPGATLRSTPRLLRGDLRAVNTLARRNPRAVPTAAAVLALLPFIVVSGWLRSTSGPRLVAIPETAS